ncbi:hypothetical protein EYC84_001450 [Monilinia fructicola]|uniref:Uncharacterized protein n=1 Tax=Monilinia fructicola TaxID=38448 RepID=A0A5M9JS65_MONFR|nr:hypothetical protein EYC84_001450 [Monilinia fructicola]
MVLLGGLEVLAAGYLIKQHLKHREEKQRLEIEALNLEEQSYRIYSPDHAGPGQRRRRHSHDRHHARSHSREYDRDRGRERSNERRHRRRYSPERKYAYDRREQDDKRKSREDVRYTNSPPPKGYYAHQPGPHENHSQMRPTGYSSTGAPSAQWVPPPPPPQQRMNSPPIITTTPLTPKLPESMLRPGVPTRGRSSSAPGDIYETPRANTSRVRIAVPGEDELTVPGETRDPPPAYEEIGGRH